jgi:hypothetical protein
VSKKLNGFTFAAYFFRTFNVAKGRITAGMLIVIRPTAGTLSNTPF